MAGKYVNPLWLSDGMEVWIPWNRERNCVGLSTEGTAVKCRVQMACGDQGYVVHDSRGIGRMFPLDWMWIPPDDPHAYFGGHVPERVSNVG